MTTVVPEVVGDFDYYFAYLDHRFAELEEVGQSWNDMTSQDQNEFLFDWPIVEDHLNDLRKLVARQALPAAYRASYQQLDERISRDRPILERLQASEMIRGR
jgi:hypothetical protein